MARLREFKFDSLKIDRAFISDISSADGPAPLVVAMIEMGRALAAEVVAEGIETPEQLEFLTGQLCARGQGYLLGRPLEPADLDRRLQDQREQRPARTRFAKRTHSLTRLA